MGYMQVTLCPDRAFPGATRGLFNNLRGKILFLIKGAQIRDLCYLDSLSRPIKVAVTPHGLFVGEDVRGKRIRGTQLLSEQLIMRSGTTKISGLESTTPVEISRAFRLLLTNNPDEVVPKLESLGINVEIKSSHFRFQERQPLIARFIKNHPATIIGGLAGSLSATMLWRLEEGTKIFDWSLENIGYRVLPAFLIINVLGFAARWLYLHFARCANQI